MTKSEFIIWVQSLPENTTVINLGGITLDYLPGYTTWSIEIGYENE